MIHYRLLKTNWGILAYLSRNDKLIKIFLPPALPACSISRKMESVQERTQREAIATFCRSAGDDFTENPELLDRLAKELTAYFDSVRVAFTAECDLAGLPDFTRTALSAVAGIPYGQTASYRDIAHRISRPASFRPVARAMSVNPIPIVIPCHRVICSDGSLGGYSGSVGPAFKQRLLAMEKRTDRECGYGSSND